MTTTTLAPDAATTTATPPPCQHRQHPTRHPGDEPATWAVLWLCPGCEHLGTLNLCEPGRRRMAEGRVGCVRGGCGYVADWAEFVIAIERIGAWT